MLIRDSKYLNVPPDDTIIWRYMDFTKFVQLIYTKTLWFGRVDILSDQFEGELPDENSNEFMNRLATIDPSMSFNSMLDKTIKERQNIRKFKSFSYVNCWTIDDNESYALWKIYLDDGKQGVAIKSTIGRIRQAFSNSDYEAVIGKVNYSDSVKDVNQDLIIGTKKPYYKYESEFRIMLLNQFKLENNNNGEEIHVPFNIYGINLNVDLSVLIDRIVISPFSQDWFLGLVSDVVQDKESSLVIENSPIRDN